MVQLKNQLPKTKRLRAKPSATMLYEPLAQSIVPHGLTEPSCGFPGAGSQKPSDYQAGITLRREPLGAVVPKKRAEQPLSVKRNRERLGGFPHRIMYSTFERVALCVVEGERNDGEGILLQFATGELPLVATKVKEAIPG